MLDTPCCFPTSLGINKTIGISNTPTLIAAFRNESSIPNIRGQLQRMEFLPINASADTPVAIQIISAPTVTGGTWNSIIGSELEINQTASISNGKVSLTNYISAVHQQGNQPSSTATSVEDAISLGLRLLVGGTFAIVATTDIAATTCDLAWSLNWLEID